MWAYRAIPGAGVCWSLTISRSRRDGGRGRRCVVVPCGVWTPAGAQRALNAPGYPYRPKWTAGQHAAFRAGLDFIARCEGDA